jgi:hypothetical protein
MGKENKTAHERERNYEMVEKTKKTEGEKYQVC